ncbi:hypothetical protein V2A60_010292 [Cordyceps javanica]|uniref:Mating-type switching protein swi10 n=1 Tax=Cordyceps javanica TaxID=43265 RepID=A0A545UUY2_9HYPO|nr:hypothetical protein IF1G_07852 [Cordyceps javanica]TQW05366.1 hypothetical protein IF2G_07303 [Cordyceps javanica]
MPHRQRLSLHIPGSPPGALPESTYTPSSDRRRSLISLPDNFSLGNLRPSRAKLQRYWPGGKSPTTTPGVAKDYATTTHDLSTLILLAGEQMGALADPRRKTTACRPASSYRKDDPKVKQDLEMTLPKSATALSRQGSNILRKPLPTNAVPQCSAPVVPPPSRAPPPPPIPELSTVNYHSGDVAIAAELVSAPQPDLPVTPVFPSTVRRRAKTPVHHIGQLEAAQRRRQKSLRPNSNMDGINRMSSVSTIAREYRELAVYPETDIPDVPKIDPSYLTGQDIAELPAAQGDDEQNEHLLGASPHNHRRTLSSVSEDGTLVGSEPDTSFGSCPSLTRSSSPPAEMSDDEEKPPPALASLRFQIGLELLTKELSTAFADHSGRQQKDGNASSAGLQIWVMIEAYERLREQLDARPAEENKQARDAIDSWIRALYAIHNNIASEGAADESEYESD